MPVVLKIDVIQHQGHEEHEGPRRKNFLLVETAGGCGWGGWGDGRFVEHDVEHEDAADDEVGEEEDDENHDPEEAFFFSGGHGALAMGKFMARSVTAARPTEK